MRRSAIAAFWLIGSIAPLAIAGVFLAGCCLLPFHRTIHKLVPLCHLAAALAHADRTDDARETVPAPRKEPAPKLTTVLPRRLLLTEAETVRPANIEAGPALHRSFITLGALRCDQDIGLHLFVATLLI